MSIQINSRVRNSYWGEGRVQYLTTGRNYVTGQPEPCACVYYDKALHGQPGSGRVGIDSLSRLELIG